MASMVCWRSPQRSKSGKAAHVVRNFLLSTAGDTRRSAILGTSKVIRQVNVPVSLQQGKQIQLPKGVLGIHIQ